MVWRIAWRITGCVGPAGVAEGALLARDLKTGASRKVCGADSGMLHPNGTEAVISVNEQDATRLYRVLLSDGRTEPIKVEGARLAAARTFGGIAPDGRIAVRITPRDSWFWPIAILEPKTGRLTRAWPDLQADQFSGGWSADGRLVGIANLTNSAIWRFEQRTKDKEQRTER